GFPPVKKGPRHRWCEEAGAYRHPVVFFEAPHRIAQTLDILSEVVGTQRVVSVCREITKKHEELIRGPLADVVQRESIRNPVGEFTCILEPAPLETLHEDVGEPRLLEEFDRMTNIGLERRAAMSQVARLFHVRTRDVFDAVERRKARAEGDE
ncbi:MAG TPA: SAM-dependent methyltransferase, partial [Luteitalea sp.]|nr:SAM-dependent methyltransferase [Luteitalea sp.]